MPEANEEKLSVDEIVERREIGLLPIRRSLTSRVSSLLSPSVPAWGRPIMKPDGTSVSDDKTDLLDDRIGELDRRCADGAQLESLDRTDFVNSKSPGLGSGASQ